MARPRFKSAPFGSTAMVIVLLVGSLLFLLMAAVGSNLGLNIRNIFKVSQIEQCRYAAYAGMQRGVFELATKTGLISFTDPPTIVNLDDALPTDQSLRYYVEIIPNGTEGTYAAPDGTPIPVGAVYIYATGYLEDGDVSAVSAGFSGVAVRPRPNFNHAALGDASVYLTGDILVDGWDGNAGWYTGATFNPGDPSTHKKNAPLGTNNFSAGVVLQDNSRVDGNLEVGPDTVDLDDAAQVIGSAFFSGEKTINPFATEIPDFESPLAPGTQAITVAPGETRTLAPGSYTTVQVGQAAAPDRATLVLEPGGLYLFEELNLATADLRVDQSLGSDPVVIYLDGDMILTGDASVNLDPDNPMQPIHVQFYFTSEADGTLTMAQSQGSFVAAGARLDANLSKAELFGALMGQNVNVEGFLGEESWIHYDTSLEGQALAGQGTWQLTSVKEDGGRGGKGSGKGKGKGGSSGGSGGSGGAGSSGGSGGSGSVGSGSTTTGGSSTSGGSTTTTSGGGSGSTSGGSGTSGSGGSGTTTTTSTGSSGGGSGGNSGNSGNSGGGHGPGGNSGGGHGPGGNSGGGHGPGGNSGGGHGPGGNSGGGHGPGGNSGGGNNGGGNN